MKNIHDADELLRVNYMAVYQLYIAVWKMINLKALVLYTYMNKNLGGFSSILFNCSVYCIYSKNKVYSLFLFRRGKP